MTDTVLSTVALAALLSPAYGAPDRTSEVRRVKGFYDLAGYLPFGPARQPREEDRRAA
jgi:hypothetical protein